MPIGKKFGTNAVKQIWAITYFTSVLPIFTMPKIHLVQIESMSFDLHQIKIFITFVPDNQIITNVH